MTRVDGYAGPSARTTIAKASALPATRWVALPKVDGAYARISVGRDGRISSILSRAGLPIAQLADLVGVVAGPPDTVLHGEAEAFTESSNRIATARGYRLIHLFDCSRYAGRDVSVLPFGERYGLLHAGQAELECYGGARREDWQLDAEGNAHDVRTGRFRAAIPRDLRRLPVLPLARGRGAIGRLWDDYVGRQGGEGIVVAALDAPLGRRRAKVKVRATTTIDAIVVSASGGAARLVWQGRPFVVSARGRWEALRPGELVEVACHGWTERESLPLHPRLIRRRDDLQPAARIAA